MPSEPRRARREAPARTSNRPMLFAAAAVVLVAAVTLAGGLYVFASRQPLPKPTPAAEAGSLRGEEVAMKPGTHVATAAELDIPAGQPPAGGPHFAQPLRAGVSAQPVPDGNAIHSLEHGLIWISYRADLVSAADLEAMRAVAHAHARDVLLSPRPGNSAAASVVSWGRRLNLASPVSREQIEDFVVANVDKSPEPGIR